MHINISYESDLPIYEQIKNQVRSQIFRGELAEGVVLPSVRILAKELKIGVVTAKRAYDDLCAEGFLHAVQSKGYFVTRAGIQNLDTYAENEIEKRLDDILSFAKTNALDKAKVAELVESFLNKLNTEE